MACSAFLLALPLSTTGGWFLLAGLVCFVASIVAVHIFHRAIASQTRTRFIWIAIAGAAIGYGIWATHFIAMLAYEPGVLTGYGIAFDRVVARCGDGSDFHAVLALLPTNPGRWRAPIGGGIIGAGIASMHYLGMWALEVPGRVTWSLDLVLASIVLGMLFGYAALAIAVRHNDRWGTFGGRAASDACHCLASFHGNGRGGDCSRSDAGTRRHVAFSRRPRLGDCRRGFVGARDEPHRRARGSPPCHPNPQI